MIQKYLLPLLCLTLWLATIVVGSSLAYCDEGDIELPQGPLPQGEINFDSDFLEQLMLSPHLQNYLTHRPGLVSATPNTQADRDLTVLIEIFKLVQTFANEFQETREKSYATVGDFRASFVRALPKILPPNVRLEVQAFQTTTNLESRIVLKTIGGGAGLRIDLHPHANGTFTFSFDPLYGEKRSFDASGSFQQGGTDWILRGSAGVAYSHKFGKYVEPGVQVLFQPQLIDFGQFRIYTETFVKFKVVNEKLGKEQRYAISEVSIVPKIVYWYSSDKGGIYGDPVASRLGDNYFKFAKDLYGFINLEFHFGL